MSSNGQLGNPVARWTTEIVVALAALLFLMPVVLIVLTVLCFNFLGDGLRDAADPYPTK